MEYEEANDFSEALIEHFEKKPITKMDNQKQKIVIDTYGGLTHTENFEVVRLFVSERANTEKVSHETLFKNHLSKITNADYRSEFVKYYKESEKAGGLLGKSQETVLENTLTNLYKLHYAANTNKDFAERIVNEKGFKIVIKNEAKNLLSGTRSYSTEVAAKEAGKLRESINALGKENSELKLDNKEKSAQLERTNKSLSNLMENVKGLFGLKQEAVTKMTEKAFKEINGISAEEIGKLKIVDRFSIEKGFGGDDYPAGVSEKEFKSYELFGYKDNKFLLKEQISFYDLDGRSSRDLPKLYAVTKDQVQELTKELSAERGKQVMERIAEFGKTVNSEKGNTKGKSTGIGM